MCWILSQYSKRFLGAYLIFFSPFHAYIFHWYMNWTFGPPHWDIWWHSHFLWPRDVLVATKELCSVVMVRAKFVNHLKLLMRIWPIEVVTAIIVWTIFAKVEIVEFWLNTLDNFLGLYSLMHELDFLSSPSSLLVFPLLSRFIHPCGFNRYINLPLDLWVVW